MNLRVQSVKRKIQDDIDRFEINRAIEDDAEVILLISWPFYEFDMDIKIDRLNQIQNKLTQKFLKVDRQRQRDQEVLQDRISSAQQQRDGMHQRLHTTRSVK